MTPVIQFTAPFYLALWLEARRRKVPFKPYRIDFDTWGNIE